MTELLLQIYNLMDTIKMIKADKKYDTYQESFHRL